MRNFQPKRVPVSTPRRWSLLLAFLSLTALPGSPLLAQMVPATSSAPTTVQIPDNLTHAQVRELIARLSDAEVRELIIRQLDKQASTEAEPPEAAYVGQLRDGIEMAWMHLSNMFTSGSRLYQLPGTILNNLTDNGRISSGYLLFQLLGLLVLGALGAWVAHWLLTKNRVKQATATTLNKRFDLACFGLVTGLIQIASFAVVAAIFVFITSRQMPVAQSFWFELIWCLVLIQLVLLAVRVVIAPVRAQPGLVKVAENSAQQALGWVLLLTSSLILPQPLIAVATDHGADDITALKLSVFFGAIFVALLIAVLVRLRHYGAQLIIGKETDAGGIRHGLARIWWMLSIVYVLAIWFLSIGKRAATGESSMVPGIGSLLLFALIPFFDRGLQWLVAWYFRDKPAAEESPANQNAITATTESPAASATAVTAEPLAAAEIVTIPNSSPASSEAPRYIATTLRYARTILTIILLLIFVRLWNINLEAMTAQLIGPTFASALFDISITVLLTWALWGMIRISIERKLGEGKTDKAEEAESEAGGLGGSRVETVLPLIRVSIKITLVVMAVLISLSSLGVNIGPLIAGAGVIGIAIGFGAQTLVRDIVSGFFYLLDDAFRIGEYVVVGNIRGAVEKISVRSFQLRHHNGPVHTVPYGEITTLTNWSRDWAIMKIELRVPFETDINMVRKIIKQIGQEMYEDPEFGPLMLAPMKSQGVNRMDDSALIIRCKFTAVPGQQYLIRREAFTRIQRVFEEKGIQFAPRRVLVEATSHEDAISGAAAVLDQEAEAEKSKPPPM
jgi:moderate conductance mechanosensitive channel